MDASNYTVTITRKAAREAGEKLYFTGKPCKQGHVDHRITINGYCRACSRISCEKYRAENPEKVAATREQHKLNRRLRREELLEIRRRKKLERNPQLATHHLDKQSRASAIAAGSETYQSVRPCKHGHAGLRFSKSYGCVECHALSLRPEPAEVVAARAAKRALSKQRAAAKNKAMQNRSAAIAAGETLFVGSPCLRGHDGLRWVASYACVECGKDQGKVKKKSAYDRAYRAKDPERWNERARKWVKANPEKRRAITFSYDARRRAQEKQGDSTAAIRKWIKSAPKVCHWCGIKCAKEYHVDHYEPLSKGGKHVVTNLVIACPGCNLKKNAKDPYEFAATVGRLF
jgi:5-methylcytosine-specific restriction endonuclease McrA